MLEIYIYKYNKKNQITKTEVTDHKDGDKKRLSLMNTIKQMSFLMSMMTSGRRKSMGTVCSEMKTAIQAESMTRRRGFIT